MSKDFLQEFSGTAIHKAECIVQICFRPNDTSCFTSNETPVLERHTQMLKTAYDFIKYSTANYSSYGIVW